MPSVTPVIKILFFIISLSLIFSVFTFIKLSLV